MESDKDLGDLIDEYVKRFDEGIPILTSPPRGYTLEDWIRECLRTGKPWDVEYEDNMIY